MIDLPRHPGLWYENPKLWAEYNAVLRSNRKEKLLALFGPFCSLCGESDEAVLMVDHVCPIRAPRGGQAIGPSPTLGRLGSGKESPFNIQILCANCHMRKTRVDGSNRWA
jgi:5-methylcytosine-specific restriction endonuclease McrA